MDQERAQAGRDQAESYLTGTRRQGYWSFGKGEQPSIEATSWCGIALRKHSEVAPAVRQYLISTQNSDSGWSTAPGAGPSDWNSSLALLACRVLSDNKSSATPLNKAAQFLEGHRAKLPFTGGLALQFLVEGPIALSSHRAWPWNDGCFHWIEPTSYALLALKPLSGKDPGINEAIEQGNQFMLSRQCKGGGWNHGDNKSLGVDHRPYPVTTAQALTALQDLPGQPAVQSGLSYLQEAVKSESTTMTLAWSIMALNLYGQEVGLQVSALLSRQESNGSFASNNLLTALALCALDTAAGDNPLKFHHLVS